MEERRTSAHRQEKIAQLVKEEVGKIIMKELDIDPGFLLTITNVKVSSDLAHATLYISTLTPEQETEVLAVLKHNAGTIQHALNRKMRTRPVPKIVFAVDVAYEKEHRLHDILSHLNDPQ